MWSIIRRLRSENHLEVSNGGGGIYGGGAGEYVSGG
jgi:hypothetical protein